MKTTIAIPTKATIPAGNSGTEVDGTMVNIVWNGRPGTPGISQQVTTVYVPISRVEPSDPGTVAGAVPLAHIALRSVTFSGATRVQATVFGPEHPSTVAPVLPVESKEPGPPKGTVQNAVPPATANNATTGQPKAYVHAYVAPVGVMTTVKNCSIVSPLELVSWFRRSTSVPGGPEFGIAMTAPLSACADGKSPPTRSAAQDRVMKPGRTDLHVVPRIKMPEYASIVAANRGREAQIYGHEFEILARWGGPRGPTRWGLFGRSPGTHAEHAWVRPSSTAPLETPV